MKRDVGEGETIQRVLVGGRYLLCDGASDVVRNLSALDADLFRSM